jgi:tetratricopeptide (TPR) repeat protein
MMSTVMNFERPRSDQELEAILRSAYGLALNNQSEQALAVCDWLIEVQETSIPGRRQRAAVLEYMGNFQDAISDLELVTSKGTREPADFYALGILYFNLGEMARAEAAFTCALELGRASHFTYYKNSCHLFRGEARLRRADYTGALGDARELPDQYSTHMPGLGMRSKEQIAADAERELTKRENSRFKFDRKA